MESKGRGCSKHFLGRMLIVFVRLAASCRQGLVGCGLCIILLFTGHDTGGRQFTGTRWVDAILFCLKLVEGNFEVMCEK